MTRQDVIGWLKYLGNDARVKADGLVPTDIEIACRIAIEALKAQEPVRPVTGLWDRDIQLFNCGACGGEIGAGGIAKYCFHCGRAVKWE